MFVNSMRNLAEESNRKPRENEVHKFVHDRHPKGWPPDQRPARANLGQNTFAKTEEGETAGWPRELLHHVHSMRSL